jgi:hypothetical protein
MTSPDLPVAGVRYSGFFLPEELQATIRGMQNNIIRSLFMTGSLFKQ